MRRLELAAIAIALGVIAALLAPSCRAPGVAISAPGDVVIDDHGDVALTATVTGSIKQLEVDLDGEATRAPVAVDRALPADCPDGCAITLRWDGDEARIGRHDLAVIAFDQDGRRGAAHVTLDVRDHVRAELARPASLDLRGVHATTLIVHARFRGGVHGALTVDGGAPIAAQAADCRDGCDLAFPLDLAAIASGGHAIAWSVRDDAGGSTRGGARLLVGDVPFVSAIRVTGEKDGPGTRLEVEVHLEDADTGAWLGCSGAGQGMESVDFDDRDYTVRAWFVKRDGTPLGMDDLAGRRVRVHVIEDDSQPCPGPIARDDDDMGTSPPVAAAALPTVRGGFGEVVALSIQIGRPR